MKLLGFSFRLETVVLCLLLGMLIHALLFCGCSKIGTMEGFQLAGALLGEKMGQGVQGSWDTKTIPKGPSLDFREQNHDAYTSKFSSPDDSLNFFSDTQFKPECCGSTYSSNGGLLREKGSTQGGCACMSKKQIDFINMRGGNRTLTSEF